MGEIKVLESLHIEDIYDKIGQTFLFCEGNTASHMFRLCDDYTILDAVSGVVVFDKKNQKNDFGDVKVITINDLPKSDSFNIVIVDKNKEEIAQAFENITNARIFFATQTAIEELYWESNNIDTLAYYERLQNENLSFRYIELETINRCNGVCSFCPVNRNEKQRPYKKMTDDLFHKIIDELHEMNYKDYIALFSNNEPFIDTRITDFAQYTRERLPEACIYLISNGTLITEEKFKTIMHYLSFLHIDTYIEDDAPEPEYLLDIRKWAEEENVTDKIYYQRTSPNAIRYSRAGSAPNKKTPDILVKEICRLPLLEMTIRPSGLVSLCCNDALGQMTLGDLNKNSLLEVWNSDVYKTVRKDIVRGRDRINLCKYCDNIDRRSFSS